MSLQAANYPHDLRGPGERSVSDQPDVAVRTYEYPAFARDAPPSWWRPEEIAQEVANDMPSSSAVVEETKEEKRLTASDPEQARAELELSFEAGRKTGFEEGRIVERQEAEGAEYTRIREQLASLVLKFDQETSRYLQDVEREVVELALAIAARVLRREVGLDPLLLTGAVRVALGQLARTTEARLKVPASDVCLWTEAIAHIPNLAMRPVVVADEGISSGDCLLETELGFADLGIQSQLAEIERNLFDAADQTVSSLPASKSAPAGGARAAL